MVLGPAEPPPRSGRWIIHSRSAAEQSGETVPEAG